LSVKKLAAALAWIVLPTGALYLFLASIGLAQGPDTCLTETRETISDLSGYEFLVTETNCDTLAKTNWVRVFVSRAGDSKRDLIFIYDPTDDTLVPNIAVDPNGNIAISIAAVEAIVQQEREWRGAKVAYSIGKVYFPEDSQSSQAKTR
jgi:hypothetical protein